MAVKAEHTPLYSFANKVETDPFASDCQRSEKVISTGKTTLHDLFPKDVHEEAVKSLVSEALEPSLWSKIAPWWLNPQGINPTATSSTSKLTEMAIAKAEPISSIPTLDKPEILPKMDLSLETAVPKASLLRKAESTSSRVLSKKEMREMMAAMSEQTMEQIMSIVLKAQLEIEQEGANLSQDCFSKLIDIKKLQERTLEDIKQALAKDEKIASYVDTAQKLTIAASFICGLVAFAVTAGIATAPVAITVAAVGPYVAAGLAALTAGASGYTTARTNEDRAKLTEFRHTQKKSTDRIDDYRERIGAFAEADSHFTEELLKLLKRLEKMKNMILQR